IEMYCATGFANSANIATASPEIAAQLALITCRPARMWLVALPLPLMPGASNEPHAPCSEPVTTGLLAGPEIVPVSEPLSLEWTCTEPGRPTCDRPLPANVIVPVTCRPSEVSATLPCIG